MLEATDKTGIELTESLAMSPPAAVSGWYFAHPKATYFGVGRVALDQVMDLARRKDMDLGRLERWLGSNLAYER